MTNGRGRASAATKPPAKPGRSGRRSKRRWKRATCREPSSSDCAAVGAS